MKAPEEDREAAIERIGAELEKADNTAAETVTVTRADLHLLFDELDRLHEREDAAYSAGIDRDLST